MNSLRVALSLAVVIGSAVLGSGAALAASVDNGKSAYMKTGCWQCHGMGGQGGITGPRLAPEPMPIEAFQAFVRSSSRQMPPYREPVLSDADLADIHAFLQSIAKPRDYKSIPLLGQ